jgi:hypothetical protein
MYLFTCGPPDIIIISRFQHAGNDVVQNESSNVNRTCLQDAQVNQVLMDRMFAFKGKYSIYQIAFEI